MRPAIVAWLSQWMSPELADLLAPTWFTFIGLAGVLQLVLMLRAGRRAGVDGAVIASAILWGYVAAVVAGLAVPMLIDAAEQLVERGHVRWRWAGMTSFWGYLAGIAAVAVVARRNGIPLPRLGDLAAAPLGVALVSARLGCFIAGCDFGKVTAVPWALRFPAGSPAWRDHVRSGLVPPARPESLPVHPTQLYEALVGVAIVVAAIAVARTAWGRARAGRVFLVGAAIYALGRLGVEELRGDVGRGFFGPLSSGQVFSLLVLLAIVAGLVWTRRRARIAIAAIAAAALASVGSTHAHAQAAPQPYPPQPQPAPVPPQPAPVAQPAPGHPAPVAPAAAAEPAPDADERSFAIGVLAGWSAPLNRRSGQVPPLAGPSLSIGYRLARGLSAWVDLDSLGNEDASHGTLLVSLGWESPINDRITFAPRFGLGSTLVNFEEPAFRDVSGVTLRAEASIEVELAERWMLWVRPLSIDSLTANDLGGPIVAWQFRVGVGYQHRKSRPRVQVINAQPPPAYPYPYPPPQPYPPQPYPPQPQPQPQPQPAPPQPAPQDPYR